MLDLKTRTTFKKKLRGAAKVPVFLGRAVNDVESNLACKNGHSKSGALYCRCVHTSSSLTMSNPRCNDCENVGK